MANQRSEIGRGPWSNCPTPGLINQYPHAKPDHPETRHSISSIGDADLIRRSGPLYPCWPNGNREIDPINGPKPLVNEHSQLNGELAKSAEWPKLDTPLHSDRFLTWHWRSNAVVRE
ncbi:hypothetical protein MMC14_002243 [Varicellaria rhodocarpa]|nr:hypothetical protein [Varicellaria rhodocarpa]